MKNVRGGGLAMANLAQVIQNFIQPRMPVIDRTGVSSRFDVDLKFEIYLSGVTLDAVSTGMPQLPQAIRDQLGLRLDRRKETPTPAATQHPDAVDVALSARRVTLPAGDYERRDPSQGVNHVRRRRALALPLSPPSSEAAGY